MYRILVCLRFSVEVNCSLFSCSSVLFQEKLTGNCHLKNNRMIPFKYIASKTESQKSVLFDSQTKIFKYCIDIPLS
uniref:Uncharacterized protein n=1 Tax=Anguilla anguilla TaxID=7936 RepID=A0A0E9WTA7_ANGAN